MPYQCIELLSHYCSGFDYMMLFLRFQSLVTFGPNPITSDAIQPPIPQPMSRRKDLKSQTRLKSRRPGRGKGRRRCPGVGNGDHTESLNQCSFLSLTTTSLTCAASSRHPSVMIYMRNLV
jgi:hypothetical protein